jgi:FkbM family methyltransferase
MRTVLSTVKDVALTLGLYRPARKIHRLFFQRDVFAAYQKLFAEFVKPGDLVFDVGANIGDVTDCMLLLGARVVAFEPQSSCLRELRARGRNLIVVEKAVGSAKGFADLHLKSANTHASLVPGYHSGSDVGIIRVPTTTLDLEIAKHGKPAFCKIDVEGFEVEVLKGLSTPINLMFEYHTDHAEQVHSCLQSIARLGDCSINLVGHDTGRWLLAKWVRAANLFEIFPACSGPYSYGDVFVRFDR